MIAPVDSSGLAHNVPVDNSSTTHINHSQGMQIAQLTEKQEAIADAKRYIYMGISGYQQNVESGAYSLYSTIFNDQSKTSILNNGLPSPEQPNNQYIAEVLKRLKSATQLESVANQIRNAQPTQSDNKGFLAEIAILLDQIATTQKALSNYHQNDSHQNRLTLESATKELDRIRQSTPLIDF